jgi:hypothetical protein
MAVEDDATPDREPDPEVLDLDKGTVGRTVRSGLSQPPPPSTSAIPPRAPG